MAENFPNTSNMSEEDEKIDLIGNLIMKIESVLSPKPINVWHLPGALEQILSPTLAIFNHGCKTGSEGKCQLWNFIFGLRVICPDMWPTYELRSSSNNMSNSDLVSEWLKLSLQSHLLFSQLKNLLDDRKRLHLYYHPWAFLRSRKYTDTLLIALSALEHNSPDKLATINPSLMVRFYSKKKKIVESQDVLFSISHCKSHIRNKISISSSNDKDVLDAGCSDKVSISDCIPIWEDDGPSSKVSPSLLHVDYNSTVFSDGGKIETKCKEHSVYPKFYCEADQEKPPDVGISHLHSRQLRRVSLPDSSFCNLPSEVSQVIKLPIASASASAEDLVSVKGLSGNNAVQPSPFLLEYLASKSKFPSLQQTPILNNLLDYKEMKSVSLLHSFVFNESDVTPDAEQLKSPSSILETSCSSSQTTQILQSGMLRKATKSISSVMGQNSEQLVKGKHSHIRSHSDGVNRIIADPPGMRKITRSFVEKPLLAMAGNPTVSAAVINKASERKTFMEDGGHSINPVADGFFPKPQPGQTLLEFLTSDQFTKTSAQLDRENAHFSVAEAVLAVVEQMNYETGHQSERRARHSIPDESEDDLSSYQKMPSHRRKLRDRNSVPFFTQNSDEEPVTTDHSVFDSPEPQSSEDDSEDHSAEICSEVPEGDSDELSSCSADPSSAENIALAILMHYNSRLLPKASELQWLVSEQDAPQKLLPIPTSVPVSPDDAEDEALQPLLRGTSDWAPPRPQLILTLHKSTKRKARLIDQKWRCAGCGLLVSEKLSSHFRLCHYLGRFFCTSCHTNEKAVVPAKVLHKWDFKKYPVCNFSYELLNCMGPDPLFHLGTLNPRLYKQSTDLHQTLIYRLQLFHARAYIFTCSKASKERTLLESVPLHWSTEPHVYSLHDLLAVKEGVLMHQKKRLTTACVNHISNCPICLGQGFICEICRQGNPIFPFQLDAVTQCTKCRECFHFLCFTPNGSCPRCERRDRREGRKGPLFASSTIV